VEDMNIVKYAPQDGGWHAPRNYAGVNDFLWGLCLRYYSIYRNCLLDFEHDGRFFENDNRLDERKTCINSHKCL